MLSGSLGPASGRLRCTPWHEARLSLPAWLVCVRAPDGWSSVRAWLPWSLGHHEPSAGLTAASERLWANGVRDSVFASTGALAARRKVGGGFGRRLGSDAVGRRGPQEGISAFIRTGRVAGTPSPCRVGTQGEAGHRQARTRALAGLRIGLRLDLGLLSPQIRERTNVLSEPPRLWWL